ncbi:MAG: hypothetical protein ABI693_02950 [Bryobacteraceae bacterium]
MRQIRLIAAFVAAAVLLSAQESGMRALGARRIELSTTGLTEFGANTGSYGRLLTSLRKLMAGSVFTVNLAGSERTAFMDWLRDHVHITNAMKYWAPDLKSHLEFFLEQQTPEGLYYDYYDPITDADNERLGVFDHRFWKILPGGKVQLCRLPLEADLEYLMVEGVYHYWQATGDTSFVRKWLPALEKGMAYSMNDPLRWSRKFRLVKRAYTIDTWDFQHPPGATLAYNHEHPRSAQMEKEIFNIDQNTPMGIMHGDNSGMYAACRQLAAMHLALGDAADGQIWNAEAETFRARTNKVCWNGRFYSHFVEDDPLPAHLSHIDWKNTLSLSNTYDVNRGLATDPMAESIIQTYLDLKQKTRTESFAEWFSIYPPVRPHFTGYTPGSYLNGNILTIVAGELAKAAFQHGYEAYGVDILDRLAKMVEQRGGQLPAPYHPDGTVDGGVPDNWGQAAVVSALIEGLAGVVDRGALFESVEISPRWLAAGIDEADVTVAYGPSRKQVRYRYKIDRAARGIRIDLSGDTKRYRLRLLLPENAAVASARVGDAAVEPVIETIRSSRYAVVDGALAGTAVIGLRYEDRR